MLTVRPRQSEDFPDRPEGELLWFHATSVECYLALCDLGQRLKTMRPDLTLLATWEDELQELPASSGCDIPAGELPQETSTDMRSFLAHWKPDLCIWGGGQLRRGLLRLMREQDIPALLVGLTQNDLPERGHRWLPDHRKRMLDGFETLMTVDEATKTQLVRLGIDEGKVKVSGHLRLSTSPPNCNAEELAHLQNILGSRPIWLAAHATQDEIPDLLTAHRAALPLLHRLFLVIALDPSTDPDEAHRMIKKAGLDAVDWDAGEEPGDFTQVLLADTYELGLWYRLAPVSFIGGSLVAGHADHSPLDAAALGSGIIHGPHLARHEKVYAQLAATGAAERVTSAQELSEMVQLLSAPDMAADMALAGWQIVTEGAALTDQLMEQAQDLLDLREEQHATA